MLKNIFTGIKKHYIACIVAIFVGLLTVAPQIFAAQSIGTAYRGLPFFALGDQDYYLSRIRDITEGHYLASSPELYEYKNTMPVLMPIGEYVYALPILILHIPILSVIAMSQFLFPALLFLLAYFLSYILIEEKNSKARLTAISIGLVIVLGYDFVDPGMLLKFLTGSLTRTHMILWTRLVNPITGALMLFSYLVVLRSLYDKQKKFRVVLAGFLLGAMIGYFFSWAYGFAITGCLLFYALYFKLKSIARCLSYTLAISLILQSAYWYTTITSMFFEGKSSSASRSGMLIMSAPLLNKLLIIATVICIISFVIDKRSRNNGTKMSYQWQWYTSLVGGAWLVLNEQVITGRAIWPYHFVQYTIPLMCVVIISSLYILFRKRPILWYSCVVGISAMSLLYGIHSAYSYTYRLPQYTQFQEYQDLYTWFRMHAEKDCVVFVSEDQEIMSRLIPAFTWCNVYHSTLIYFGVPQDRILHNYLSLLRLQEVPVETIHEYLLMRVGDVNSLFYSDWHEAFLTEPTDDNLKTINRISAEYEKFVKTDFRTELRKYKIDYIISTKQLSSALIHELSVIDLDREGGYYIYRF